jgi:hypothetical protein
MLMASPARKTRIGLIVMVIFTLGARPADAADGCDEHPTFGNISGSRDTVLLSGAQAAKCRSEEKSIATTQVPGPYYTEQIVCSTDPVQAAEGLCSATPCPTSFFALRTLHFPDGRAEAAGSRCVSLEQAVAAPGVTVAQVFEAVRRVKLPGGEIGVEPGVRGLANLQSFFWVEGGGPVAGRLGGGRVDGACGVSGAGVPVVVRGWGAVGDEGAGQSGAGE